MPQAGVAKHDPMVSMGAPVDRFGDAAIDVAVIPAAAAAAAAACGQSTAAAANAVVR